MVVARLPARLVAAVVAIVVQGSDYVPLGDVTHVAGQRWSEDGRRYTATAPGQGSWQGRNEPLGKWGWIRYPEIIPSAIIHGSEGVAGVRCDQTQAGYCKDEYDHCVRHEGIVNDLDLACHCSEIYFSQCLRAAGCANDYMFKCYEQLKLYNCSDITLCGNNCVTQAHVQQEEHQHHQYHHHHEETQGHHHAYGDDVHQQHETFAADHHITKSITMQIYNEGMNFLKISSCNLTYDPVAYEMYGMMNQRRCDDLSYRRCPYWVPPKTLTSLTIDYDTSYLLVEHCVYPSEPGQSLRCLDFPEPLEVHATGLRWPAVLEVTPANHVFCDDDADCPGSFCRKIKQPPHVCNETALNHTVYQGFTQPGDIDQATGIRINFDPYHPHNLPEDWKVLMGPYYVDDFAPTPREQMRDRS